MRKNKRYNFTKSGIASLCKNIVLLLLGILLIGAGILIHWTPWKDAAEPLMYGVVVFAFGDGFDSLFVADINVEFTDLGKTELEFTLSEKEDGPQNAWIVVWEPLIPYTWSIEGNVENRHFDGIENMETGRVFKCNWTTTKTGLTHGENDRVSCFRVTVDDDDVVEKITIQMDEEQAVCRYGDILEVATPVVATLTTRYYDIYTMDSIINHLEEIVEEYQMDDDDIAAFVRHTFSAGSIDGVELSPAFSKIYGRYKSEKYYYDNQRYELRKKAPVYGEEYMQYITWDNEGLRFMPTIEYRERRSVASQITEFLLLSLGSFLLPIPCGNIYSIIMKFR